jgi:hypothetical protein
METKKQRRIAIYLLIIAILVNISSVLFAYAKASSIEHTSWTYPVAGVAVFLTITGIGSVVCFILLLVGFFISVNLSLKQKRLNGLIFIYFLLLAFVVFIIISILIYLK